MNVPATQLITATPSGMENGCVYTAITAWTEKVLLFADPSITIYYTTNGEEPTLSSAVYTNGVYLGSEDLDENTNMAVLKYVGVKNNKFIKPIYTSLYVFDRPVALACTIPSGEHPEDVEIALYSDIDTIIYYRLDNEALLDQYGNPLKGTYKFCEELPMFTGTLKAVAFNFNNGTYSNVVYREFTAIQKQLTLAVSHESGSYSEPIAVRLTASDPEALIRYTLDGSDPLKYTAAVYDTALILGNDNLNVKIRAVAVTQDSMSPEVTATYSF